MTKQTLDTVAEVTTETTKEASTETATKTESGSKYLITFNKPYQFEGKEYTEIDLKGLENLTAADIEDADQQFSMTGKFDPSRENSMAYCMLVAAIATKKPIDFFRRLNAKDATKIKLQVTSFLLI